MCAILEKGWKLAVVEAGVGGELSRRLVAVPTGFQGGQVLAGLPTPDELLAITDAYRRQQSAEVGLGVAIYPEEGKHMVQFVLITPQGQQQLARPYGGPPEYAPRWALHHGLDILRQI